MFRYTVLATNLIIKLDVYNRTTQINKGIYWVFKS